VSHIFSDDSGLAIPGPPDLWTGWKKKALSVLFRGAEPELLYKRRLWSLRMERPGKILKETRESKDITLREASQVTKIGIRFLKALENDEYDIFPSYVYMRSFLKNYANFLGLDGEKLSREFKSVEPSPPKNFSPPRYYLNGHLMKIWFIVLTMLSIWVLWIIYQTVIIKF
jgi:cytoskeletal protein RodZ